MSAQNVPNNIETHVYDGEINGNNLDGLHAYSDNNGGLPNNVHQIQTEGSVNGPHILYWTSTAIQNNQHTGNHAGNPKTMKSSSMFPQWLATAGTDAVILAARHLGANDNRTTRLLARMGLSGRGLTYNPPTCYLNRGAQHNDLVANGIHYST